MNNAESNFKERLASLVKTAQPNPFDMRKAAEATDAQLGVVLDDLAQRSAPAATPVSAVPAPVAKTAPQDAFSAMNLADILKSAEFRKGFSSVYASRVDELEHAFIEKKAAEAAASRPLASAVQI